MFKSFISILYPKICVHCKNSLVKGEEDLCTKCLEQLPVNDRINDFSLLRYEIISASMFRSLFYYLKFYKGGITQSLLHQIKYEGNTELAENLGGWYGDQLSRYGLKTGFDIIVPVPLHKRKLRIRGYNQSEFIARGLTKVLTSEMDTDFLKRVVNNPTQTRKGRLDRLKNVENIFKVMHSRHPIVSRILLVDDVITTGATLEACARVLLEAGYMDLSFATLAYARK